MPDPHVRRLRILSLIDGISLLILMGIAMPLKYMAGMPMAVKVVGWVHGMLFVAFSLALANVHFRHRWPVLRSAVVFIAAVIPFGPFVIDRRLREDWAEPSTST